jgi:CRP/FNR family transcriptional regulator, cyclic AMP receptor protein
MDKGPNVTTQKSEKVSNALSVLLEDIVGGMEARKYRKGAKLFSQGAEADAIYFIQVGKVKVTVISAQGKEAVLAIMGPRDFLGEGCLVGALRRTSTAMCLEASSVFRIEKRDMLKGLRTQSAFCENFVASLLARNVSLEEDLCDQLFNHSEKRLARVLLKLSRVGKHAKQPDAKVPRVSQETLAEIVGTTRSRINFFMNKFKRLGLIDYKGKGDITVMPELLTEIVLHD